MYYVECHVSVHVCVCLVGLNFLALIICVVNDRVYVCYYNLLMCAIVTAQDGVISN